MNRKDCFNVFRVALIVDSAIFVYKFAVAIWLFVYGIRDRKAFDGRYGEYEEMDSSGEMLSAYFRTRGWSIESGIFVIIILFRWLANVSQYNNEKRSSGSKNLLKYFGCGCCKSCCWFIVSALNFLMDVILIFIDWTGWLAEVAISCLAWELLMTFFMIAYKSYLIDQPTDPAFAPTADLPNRQIIDHQDAPPPYHIYANNNIPSAHKNDSQDAPPSYELYTNNAQQIN